MRRALWLLNRVEWLQEQVALHKVDMRKLAGHLMAVDGETKHIPFDVWVKHMSFKLNRDLAALIRGSKTTDSAS